MPRLLCLGEPGTARPGSGISGWGGCCWGVVCFWFLELFADAWAITETFAVVSSQCCGEEDFCPQATQTGMGSIPGARPGACARSGDRSRCLPELFGLAWLWSCTFTGEGTAPFLGRAGPCPAPTDNASRGSCEEKARRLLPRQESRGGGSAGSAPAARLSRPLAPR